MPRKPKPPEKQVILVTVHDKPVTVYLHPPGRARRTWYAYWQGLGNPRSTGQATVAAAAAAAQAMLSNGGKTTTAADTTLSDEELEAIQRAHFAKKTDPAARRRAEKTLEDCLDAIAAFKEITGLKPITRATPDDCERFQIEALRKPKNWRQQYPGSKKKVENLSPNTVLKWSRCLQAAFERVNRNANRRKCVRGVVDASKLLTANPWSQFSWIEGVKRPIRQFDDKELLSLMDFFETDWDAVPLGALAAKVFLWSSARKLEVASLQWSQVRTAGHEVHFEIVGKWGIERWFRLPEALYQEMLGFRTESPYVFAAYNDQIRRCHADNPGTLRKITDQFDPANFGRWFYERIKEWSQESTKGRAFVHVFRKTTLQHARRGEDINRQVAADARVGEAVLMTSYVKESDEEMRQKSNRTFQRIMASLSAAVARRYGHVDADSADLTRRLRVATEARDWPLVAAIASRLGQGRRPGVG
jgi:integrase